MIVIKNLNNFLGTSLIADLASRTGLNNSGVFKPIAGLRDKIDAYLAARNINTLANIIHLFAVQKDFDMDTKNPNKFVQNMIDKYADVEDDEISDRVREAYLDHDFGVDEDEDLVINVIFDPNTMALGDSPYPRTLEDISRITAYNDALDSYVMDILKIIATRRNSNGIIEYNSTHKVQQELNFDEDSETTEVTDIISERKVSTYNSVNVRRLPFLLKRLFYLGLDFHVHGPSFIVAYFKAENYLASKVGSVKTLTHQVVFNTAGAPLYKYNVSDVHGENPIQLTNENNDYIRNFTNWLNKTTKDPLHESYRNDIDEFLGILTFFKIKLDVAAFSKITLEYLNNHNFNIIDLVLNSNYDHEVSDRLFSVEEDKEAKLRETFGDNPVVLQQLQLKERVAVKSELYADALFNCPTVKDYLNALTSRGSGVRKVFKDFQALVRKVEEISSLNQVMSVLDTLGPDGKPVSELSFQNDILYTKNNVVYFPAKLLWSQKYNVEGKFMVTEQMICILLDTSKSVLTFTTITEINAYLEKLIEYRDPSVIPNECLPREYNWDTSL